MGIATPVNIGTNTGSAVNSVSVTVGAGGVPSGATIFISVFETSTVTPGLAACADTAGNTYSRASIGGAGILSTYFCGNALALVNTNTITVTLAQTGKNAAVSAFYFMSASGQRDFNGVGASGTSTTPSAGASTPNSNGSLIIGIVGSMGTSADTFTQDSTNGAYLNFPVRVGIAGTGGPTIAGGSLVQSAAASINYAPTLGTSRAWQARLQGFSAAPVSKSLVRGQAITRAAYW